MNSDPREIIVSLKSAKLAVKVWGAPEGTPILALHGWLDNAGTFDLLAPYLGKFQLFAVDMPGHGLSSHWAEGMSYHSIDAVGVVAQIIEHFAWEKVTILGHSMGASIASLFAGVFPERLDKLILIEGLGPLAAPPEDGPARLKRSILQYADLPNKKMPCYSSPEHAIEARRKASNLSREAATAIVLRGIKEISGGFTWRTDPRLKTESPFRMTEEQVIAFLNQITCPVLWVRANQGMQLDIFMSPSRQLSIRHLKIFRLDGNHHVHLEDPKKVAEALLDFLSY